jgi:hypothetical protein
MRAQYRRARAGAHHAGAMMMGIITRMQCPRG